jgi:hypothetical protein
MPPLATAFAEPTQAEGTSQTAESPQTDGSAQTAEPTQADGTSQTAEPPRFFEQQITKEIPPEGINNLESYFPQTVAIREGSYQGEIGLRTEEPFNIESVYESLSGQVDRVQVFYDLPDNDLLRIPEVMEFEVRDDASPDATQTLPLTMVDCVYSMLASDAFGRPSGYNAAVTYRGEEHWLEIHHYLVTANYSGNIALPATTTTSPGTAETPLSTTAAIAAQNPPLALPSFNWLPVVAAAGITVILLLGLLLLFLMRYTNMRVVSIDGYGVPRTVVRRRGTLSEGLVRLRMPASFQGFDPALRYELLIRQPLASKDGLVELVWRGQVWLRCPLASRTDVTAGIEGGAAAAVVAALADIADVCWEPG